MINLVKTEHILTDMIKDAENRLQEATHAMSVAEEEDFIGRKGVDEAQSDVKEIEEILQTISRKVSGPFDLAASPGVLEMGRKALEQADRKLSSHKEASKRHYEEVLRAREEVALRLLELKLLKIADVEINH